MGKLMIKKFNISMLVLIMFCTNKTFAADILQADIDAGGGNQIYSLIIDNIIMGGDSVESLGNGIIITSPTPTSYPLSDDIIMRDCICNNTTSTAVIINNSNNITINSCTFNGALGDGL